MGACQSGAQLKESQNKRPNPKSEDPPRLDDKEYQLTENPYQSQYPDVSHVVPMAPTLDEKKAQQRAVVSCPSKN
jgi:hypothetical protein